MSQNKTGKVITLRDLLNLRSHQPKAPRVEHQTELETVVEVIQVYDENTIVEVAVSEDSHLVGIYMQDSAMVKTFADFPELLIVNASNRIAAIKMRLYLLMAMDGHGRLEIVATFLSTEYLSTDTQPDTFRHVIQTFLHHNSPCHTKTRAVIIDRETMSSEFEILTEQMPSLITDPRVTDCFQDECSGGMKINDRLSSIVEKIQTLCKTLVSIH